MRISPEKRSANRRNALKSTGPKTAQGKKTSARNALRHGLSAPLPPHLIDPLQRELTQLIERDGIERDTARDLAQKIIDYERNLAFLRHAFEDEMIVGEGVEKDHDHGIGKWQKDFRNRFVDIHTKFLKGMPWEIGNVVRLATQMNQIIATTKRNEMARSRRYFKRSSNQLIKAVRRL